jgi:hypothetical protein
VFDVQKNCFQLRLQEPHPYVVGVVVDDEQAIAEAMWEGDNDWSPAVSGHVEEGTGWFRASGGVARCSCGFV